MAYPARQIKRIIIEFADGKTLHITGSISNLSGISWSTTIQNNGFDEFEFAVKGKGIVISHGIVGDKK